MNKFFLVIILSFYLGNYSFGQMFNASPSITPFQEALSKIVVDFRFNFKNIQGQQIAKQGSAETYECTVVFPEQIEAFVYQYNSTMDTSGSVQIVMYRGDDFVSAKKKYTEIYKTIKNTKVKWPDRSLIGFDGEFQKPTEDIRFASSTLDFDLNDKRYERFKAEVALVSTYTGWEVHLNLQTQQEDRLLNKEVF